MLTQSLLEKLIEIERSVGNAAGLSLRNTLMEAQTEALLIEKEHLELLLEVRMLREEFDPLPRSPLCSICPVCNAGIALNGQIAQA